MVLGRWSFARVGFHKRWLRSPDLGWNKREEKGTWQVSRVAGLLCRNIMTGNVAFGTAAPAAPIPERPPAASEAPLAGELGPASAAAADPGFEAARRAREVRLLGTPSF